MVAIGPLNGYAQIQKQRDEALAQLFDPTDVRYRRPPDPVTSTWVCDYCDSTNHFQKLKCESCAAPKPAQVVEQYRFNLALK